MINNLIAKLEINLKEAIKTGTQMNSKAKILFDFQKNRQANMGSIILADIKLLQKKLAGSDEDTLDIARQLTTHFQNGDKTKLLQAVQNLRKIIPQRAAKEEIKIILPEMPSEVKDEIETDIKEMRKCCSAGCYRSAVILCGRILETALHRKYYDVTGNDALEKSPGIGLGNLIAKLNEKGVDFEPGVAQQIHLINQARIFSVHKKQRPFYPSKAQADAIILFTMDTLEKMF